VISSHFSAFLLSHIIAVFNTVTKLVAKIE
jgi:hypothetical protein